MTSLTESRVESLREKFPALARLHNQDAVIYLDGPAGTQVPQSVADRIQQNMLHHNANRSGCFATSEEVDAIVDEAQAKAAALLGTDDQGEIVFGPNMTSLNFQLSRALAQTWQSGDEIVLTRLDHDANVTPWVLAARDRGVSVRFVDIDTQDATLHESDFAAQVTRKTRLVAFTCASNSVGSKTDVSRLVQIAKSQSDALVCCDAVHFAPHGLIDVQSWDCDFLLCSAYKFYGPHIGILWGKRKWLEGLDAYKVRPAPECIPAKWMTGTQNHACIAGVSAAIDYLANIAQPDSQRPLREQLSSSLAAIADYERELGIQLLKGMLAMPHLTVYGITDANRSQERVPTFALTIRGMTSRQAAKSLGDNGIFAWHGNYYALQLSERLNREPDGMLRLGLMHYNTRDEVVRTLDRLAMLQ